MTDKKELLDLSTFNTVAACDDGSWLPFNFGGKPTGVDFLILGDHSAGVQAYETEKLKSMARKSAAAEKRKATNELLLDLIESRNTRSIDDAVARVAGWRGVKGEYSKDAMREFLSRNPQFIDEILEHSRDTTVFTKAL